MFNCNLIIDGNYLLMKSVFILHKNRMLHDLDYVLENDFNTLISLHPFNKIYFISDSKKNWRKDIFPGYKGTRKKDININWEYVFDVYNDVKEKIQERKKNFLTYNIDYLEGDDLISYIVNESNKIGSSNMIMGNDSDLFQLIKYDDNYINVMYNFQFKNESVYLPEGYELLIDKIEQNHVHDLFGDEDDLEIVELVKKLSKTSKKVIVNNEFEMFMKIMGHNKDSIHSIFMTGTRGIGKSGISKVYDLYKTLYPEVIDFNSDEFKKNLLFVVKKYKKLESDEKDEEILRNLNRNIKLTKLDESNIPNHLYDKMTMIDI